MRLSKAAYGVLLLSAILLCSVSDVLSTPLPTAVDYDIASAVDLEATSLELFNSPNQPMVETPLQTFTVSQVESYQFDNTNEHAARDVLFVTLRKTIQDRNKKEAIKYRQCKVPWRNASNTSTTNSPRPTSSATEATVHVDPGR